MLTIRKVLQYLDENGTSYEYKGNNNYEIKGYSSLTNYKQGTMTWIKNLEKFKENKMVLDNPLLVIIDWVVNTEYKCGNKIICDNPKNVFYNIIEFFYGNKVKSGIGTGTIISNSAILGKNILIGNHCTIGDNVQIGENTIIYHNVVIGLNVTIGCNCIIKSGAVIGEDGYGYSKIGDKYIHISHFGSVMIADGVEIGSNTCIDRGTIDNTEIGSGTKIDNLCHIAHNVKIGENVSVIAGSIIAGSAKIEDGVYIAPGGIIRNQVKIGRNALIGLGTLVISDVENDKVVVGVPGKVIRDVSEKENL